MAGAASVATLRVRAGTKRSTHALEAGICAHVRANVCVNVRVCAGGGAAGMPDAVMADAADGPAAAGEAGVCECARAHAQVGVHMTLCAHGRRTTPGEAGMGMQACKIAFTFAFKETLHTDTYTRTNMAPPGQAETHAPTFTIVLPVHRLAHRCTHVRKYARKR